MSERANEFIEDWIRENINAQAYVSEDQDDPRPQEYAQACILEAEAAGIPRSELEEESDLVARMAEAIDDAADTEVARLSAKDD